MKVYVSEQDNDFLDACLSETICYEFVEFESDYQDTLKLQSLEQHDAEIRKPLEDEIDREIQKYKDKIKELEVYKKALELSIKKSVGLMGYGTVEIDRQAEIKWKEQYLEQARKELEDDK